MLLSSRCLLLMGVLMVAYRSFVSGAFIPLEGVPEGSQSDDAVEELEKLKPKGKSVTMLKSHASFFSNMNGRKEHHSQTKEELDKDGEVVARVSQQVDKNDDAPAIVKTSVDIPSKNIHRVIQTEAKTEAEIKKTGIFSSEKSNENSNTYPGLRYSPLDMAEYVFWTGDEKGATLAIEEFLQNGLMTREQAIGYLMDIKQSLEYLQNHYNEDRHSALPKEKSEDKIPLSDINEARQQLQDGQNKRTESQDVNPITEEDYEDLLEKLRLEDLLYKEYSLEEVIYQLAKLMFTQSLTRGSAEAQDTLQKFTSFLENEAIRRHISKNLEEKVLDVLIASLADTLTEHPELENTARESLGLPITQVARRPDEDRLLEQYMTQGKTGNLSPRQEDSGVADEAASLVRLFSQLQENSPEIRTPRQGEKINLNQFKM